MKHELPELFAEKHHLLRVIKEIYSLDQLLLAEVGEEFVVEDIVGYGFDLVGKNNPMKQIRVLNSKMSEYFQRIN